MLFFGSEADETIRKAALAVAVNYMEHRDDDEAARSALKRAIPSLVAGSDQRVPK